MHRNTLLLIVGILCIYFSLVLCEDYQTAQDEKLKESNNLINNDKTALQGEARRRIRGHLHSLWGFYGLAIAYLIKVKVIVVAFLVGSAVYLGLHYLWPHKCGGGGFYKEGSIILDHPPSFAHHDHVPYSFDPGHQHNHYDSGSFTSSGPASFDPYSAYSSHTLSETQNSYPTASDGTPEMLPADAPTFRRKRSEPRELKEENGPLEKFARQMVLQEEQIGEFMLNFLGLDTTSCRQRFVCEMEFRSKTNPLTSMAFRVIGRSLFAKYTNNENSLGKATSFEECAAVNPDCKFIENDEETEQDIIDGPQPAGLEMENSTDESNQEPVTPDSSVENNNIMERTNENNLRAELSNSWRKRLRSDRYLKLA